MDTTPPTPDPTTRTPDPTTRTPDPTTPPTPDAQFSDELLAGEPFDAPYDFDFEFADEHFADPGGAAERRERGGPKDFGRTETPTDWPYGEFPETNRPLVVVPGIMGSRLNRMENGHPVPVWPPITSEGIGDFDALRSAIANKNTHAAPGDVLSSYSGLLSRLAMEGYHQGVNLLFFTYDWTKSNRVNGQRLATTVAGWLRWFNRTFGTEHREVDVICHSMGGLVTRCAIQHHAMPARRTVYIATPHYGAPNAYFVLHPDIEVTSWAVELAWDLFGWLLDRDDFEDLDTAFHTIASMCDSVWELLPNSFYLDKVKMLRIESKAGYEQYLKGTKRTYFANDAWRFNSWDSGRARAGLAFTESLGMSPPGDHLLIVGPNVSTPDQIEFDFEYAGDHDFEDVESSPRAGDGTVPIYSACAARGRSRHAFVPNTGHTALPNHPTTFRLLADYLGL